MTSSLARVCEAVWRGYVVRLRGCRSAYMLAEGSGRAEQEAVEAVEASLRRVGLGLGLGVGVGVRVEVGGVGHG